MDRKVNRYFITIPIFNIKEAKYLGSETNWEIMEVLRDAGVKGLSAEEISKKIEIPTQSVYGTLSKLEAADLIEGSIRRTHLGRPTKEETKKRSSGKPTKVFTENIPWGYSGIDEEFEESLNPLLTNMDQNIDEIRQKWLPILDRIVSTYETGKLKKFFPQDEIHEQCGCNHEATEFLHAISLSLLWKILEGKEYDELAKRHKFMK
jgi:hypothetical protein